MSSSEDSKATTDHLSPADGQHSDSPSRWRLRHGLRWLIGTSALLWITAVLLTVWSLFLRSDNTHDNADQPAETRSAWAEIAAELPPDSNRRYTDEELGLEALIDDIVLYRPYFARFRTEDAYMEHQLEHDKYIYEEATGHERERLAFEREIESAILTNYGFLPEDIGPDGMLEQAFDEWMEECAADAGYPDVQFDLSLEPDGYREDFGLPYDEFLDLRHECARRAAAYPTLDPEIRDDLIYRLRKHLLMGLHDYIRDFDVVEISVEHRDGDLHPIEESYIGRCLELEISERESCAEYYRVELTDEQKTAPVPERIEVDESGPYPLVGQSCPFSEFPGEVIIDREGSYCDRFENLEFVINYPETSESENYVSNLFWGGERLLICPTSWVINDEGKCRYPRPEEAALRAAFVAEHPEHADYHDWPLYSSRYPDKN